LADFQEQFDEFKERNIRVIGLSIDDEEDAKKTVDQHDLTIPVAYGVDSRDFAEKTGAYIDEENGYIHAAGFILNPEGEVAGAVYSTGAIGRYTPKECVGMIDYWTKKS